MACCCDDFKRYVIESTARTAPTDDPVIFTVERPLADLPANHCFELYIPMAILVNETYFTTELSDGTTTLPMATTCAVPVRYDSLINYCCSRSRKGYLRLQCKLVTDPAPGHICVLTKLPRSSYQAVPVVPSAPTA